jgi:hypothetical protein
LQRASALGEVIALDRYQDAKSFVVISQTLMPSLNITQVRQIL